ncbi:MAG: DUF3365 domain-containing protein [Gammaproteobacteria bacterium]|nr:DUF3365 domain-containing protein [Gammaproteobacteria bacterium]MBT8111699.1 DUF3365 domain-containing protein [Gammaproteobacteria bacterium]NND46847.1 DUF3365 domain-containing protein [Woeseiaceae bacterium]NNL46397.1 DUF3365 domain-containing protein [Woeseiaceae bacterium]
MKTVSIRTLPAYIAAALSVACLQAADEPRLDESRALVQSFAATLQSELKKGLSQGGPVGAISVCKDKAPQVASDLSRQSGAKVRRTSLRFRNPANAPEPWERSVLLEFERQADGAEPAAGLEHFVQEADGTIRYMAVIRTGAVCLTCHGASLSPELAAILDADYPHDRALGYSLGDVRGAFSVTWPPSGDASSR